MSLTGSRSMSRVSSQTVSAASSAVSSPVFGVCTMLKPMWNGYPALLSWSGVWSMRLTQVLLAMSCG